MLVNAVREYWRKGVNEQKLTVIKAVGVANLVEENLDVLHIQALHEVLPPDPLTPVTTSTTAHAVSQPKRVVVVTLRAARALAVVVVLVEEAAAGLGALGDALGVGVGVDVDAVGRALEEGLVLHGPAHNLDGNILEGEAVEAVGPLEPALVLVVEDRGNLGALILGDRGVGLPPDADVDLAVIPRVSPRPAPLCLEVWNKNWREDIPVGGHELVPAKVLEAKQALGVRVEAVVPDLLKRRHELARRVPTTLALGGPVELGARALAHGSRRLLLPNRAVEVREGRHVGRRGRGGQGEEDRLRCDLHLGML